MTITLKEASFMKLFCDSEFLHKVMPAMPAALKARNAMETKCVGWNIALSTCEFPRAAVFRSLTWRRGGCQRLGGMRNLTSFYLALVLSAR